MKRGSPLSLTDTIPGEHPLRSSSNGIDAQMCATSEFHMLSILDVQTSSFGNPRTSALASMYWPISSAMSRTSTLSTVESAPCS